MVSGTGDVGPGVQETKQGVRNVKNLIKMFKHD